jgi:hypothetical protein
VIPQVYGIKAMGAAALVCVLLAGALALTGRAYLGEIRAHGETRAALGAEQRARAADAQQAQRVNAENLAVIQFQDAALAEFRADADARQRASDEALARAQARASGLQRMLDAERRARAAIYAADPDARAWAGQLVPLAIEQRIRGRA